MIAADASAYVRLDGTGVADGEVSVEDRFGLVSRYVGVDTAADWLAGHPLPGPNAKLRITPRKVVGYGLPGR